MFINLSGDEVRFFSVDVFVRGSDDSVAASSTASRPRRRCMSASSAAALMYCKLILPCSAAEPAVRPASAANSGMSY